MPGPSRRPAAARPDPDLRIGTAERERAVEELGRHFRDGRLTTEELEDRTLVAHRARTAGDLVAVLADLPAPAPAVVPAVRPASRHGGRRANGHAVVGVLAVIGLLAVGVGGLRVGSSDDSVPSGFAAAAPAPAPADTVTARLTNDAIVLTPRAVYAGRPVLLTVVNAGTSTRALRLEAGPGTQAIRPGERGTLDLGVLGAGRHVVVGTAPGGDRPDLRATLDVRP